MTDPQRLRAFFDAFGYAIVPGALAGDIAWISEAFDEVLQRHGSAHDGTRRTSVTPFIERSEALCRVLELPAVERAATALLGPDWSYFCSDGNCYAGDTGWHPDCDYRHAVCLKIAFYLDPLAAGNGALRIIPGSHRRDDWQARRAGEHDQLWGIAGERVPAVALATAPGDLVAFDARALHASFGGGTKRRMFSLVFFGPLATPEASAELDRHLDAWTRLARVLHTDLLQRTASPSLRPHLRQVSERQARHPHYRASAAQPIR